VNYCSVECQRIDWTEGGHKSSCGREPLSPQAAWGELQQTLMQLSPQEAHQQLQKAQDEIKRLEQEETHRIQAMKEESSRRAMNVAEEKKARDAIPKNEKKDSAFSFPLTSTCTETKIPGEHAPQRDWLYVVEEMPNISSYHVTLWAKAKGDALPDPNDVVVSMQQTMKGNTLVTIHLQDTILFSAQFPGRLVEAPESTNAVRRQSDCMSLRLQSRDTFDAGIDDNSTTSISAVCSICCRYCDQAIVAESQGIRKALPLPKGHWDEVTDYLICYNGVSGLNNVAESEKMWLPCRTHTSM